MVTQDFRTLEVGDAFRLDGRVYQKRTKYSALLIRMASGELPSMKINRMIDPAIAVESENEPVDSN